MRHSLWIAAALASAALAVAGCSTTASQPSSESRGDIGNGAFGEAVPAQYGEPAPSHVATSDTANVQGHGFTGNGAFGEAP